MEKEIRLKLTRQPLQRLVIINKLQRVKKEIEETRYNTYLYLSLWKIFWFLLFTIILSNEGVSSFFNNFKSGWGDHFIQVNETQSFISDLHRYPDLVNITSDLIVTETQSMPMVIFWTFLIHFLASYCCYVFAKFSCKIHIQTFSFAVPINLTTPVCISVILILSGLRATDVCYFHGSFPDYLFLSPPPVYNLDQYLVKDMTCLSFFWLMSQLWITRHIWVSKANKNASTDQLFVTPGYDSLVIDQSLAMNRRRDDLDIPEKKNMFVLSKGLENHKEEDIDPEDKIPQLFVCATMWHEEKDEMKHFLKSILRMDEDHSARSNVRKYFQKETEKIDRDYYDLETHIFFDDAFVTDKCLYDQHDAQPINTYVKDFITVLEEALTDVYDIPMKVYPPKRTQTPYGGRFEWQLPGGTNMICHLKHANKIRKKKRWSQVMYMYYLLRHKINLLDASENRKKTIAKNTFLLALDGDIDFQPQAVSLLLDRMKVDDELGAACGRIHPVGSGPMAWYQKFEYAIGHWLQKATEHIIGCVLCSPGCFSLFRGSALMLDGVMGKYTTESKEARDFVQYDQGEDRWLCTLLLKSSYRVEYSAAANAYTHCPVTFPNFFIQRRRWIPSTMSNILDLLSDAKQVVDNNNSISMMYIFYQMLLFVGTVLGPGTIFMMMVGSVVSVFDIGIWTAFLWNFIPLVIFMCMCIKCKQEYQIMFAMVMTAVYALVMMAVLIGVIIQIKQDSLSSPTSIFFITVAIQISITGLLHPQEWSCLKHGVIYYLSIPSMYMLLIIFCVFNMNDVSWGTRENEKDSASTKDVAEEHSKSRIEKLFGSFKKDQGKNNPFSLGLGSMCSCLLCSNTTSSIEQGQLLHIITQLDSINKKLTNIDEDSDIKLTNSTDAVDSEQSQESKKEDSDKEEKPNKRITFLPDWMSDPDFKACDIGTLSDYETKFWEILIEKPLRPIESSEEEEKNNNTKKNELRNGCVSAFLMANSLLVLVVFLLQLNKDVIYIRWPVGAINTIVFDENQFTITIFREYLHLEPIGLLFVLFFGAILVIQFIAMLLHRFSTFSQILAVTTVVSCFNQNPKGFSPEADLRGKALFDLAKRMQQPVTLFYNDELDNNKQDWSCLETNFLRQYKNDNFLNVVHRSFKNKNTAMSLKNRRLTIVDQGSIATIKRNAKKNISIKKNKTLSQSQFFIPTTSVQNSSIQDGNNFEMKDLSSGKTPTHQSVKETTANV